MGEEEKLAAVIADSDTRIIKKAFLGQAVVILMAMAATWITFYFTTKFDVKNLYEIVNSHSEQIHQLQTTQSELSTSVAIITTNPNSFQIQVDGMNKRLDRVEEKQDQIYQLLVEMQQNK